MSRILLALLLTGCTKMGPAGTVTKTECLAQGEGLLSGTRVECKVTLDNYRVFKVKDACFVGDILICPDGDIDHYNASIHCHCK